MCVVYIPELVEGKIAGHYLLNTAVNGKPVFLPLNPASDNTRWQFKDGNGKLSVSISIYIYLFIYIYLYIYI